MTFQISYSLESLLKGKNIILTSSASGWFQPKWTNMFVKLEYFPASRRKNEQFNWNHQLQNDFQEALAVSFNKVGC